MKVTIVYGDESVQEIEHTEFESKVRDKVQIVKVHYPGHTHTMSLFDSYFVFEQKGIVYCGGLNKQTQPYTDQPNDKKEHFNIEEILKKPLKFGKTIDTAKWDRIREKYLGRHD